MSIKSFQRLIFTVCLALVYQLSEAQYRIMKTQTKQRLKELSGIYHINYQNQKKFALEFARENKIPLVIKLADGSLMALEFISPNGHPNYIKNFNIEAAITTSTDHIQSGGNLGLSLTGSGLLVGVWEAQGIPNLNHQEFNGRVQQKDNPSALINDHSTHVIGTITASGVNPAAKGMAPASRVNSYDSSADTGEMAEEASLGLILSNHSYGLALGWEQQTNGWQWFGDANVDENVDYRFGFYTQKSKNLDQIAFNAPYYLQVWAAGNDRTDNGPPEGGAQPPDGQFDTIGPEGIAKNVLTIGAVSSVNQYNSPLDISMSNFSSWGPADDGRIKPDVVANGIGVLSSGGSANDAYVTLQGTSMAAPNTTGSLLLVQELYNNLYGDFMMSSTLKGLAIHTAMESGQNEGPDYQFGWGLLNVERMAVVLLKRDSGNYFIIEDEINEGTQIEYTIQSDGLSNIVATLAWIDVPGNPVSPSVDPSDLMLVNDLDIKIIDANNIEYQPWILEPSEPSKKALHGDNFRDNVEKIEIVNPVPGLYTLRISHKGTLVNGLQNFSLILTSGNLDNNRNTVYWIGNSGNWDDPTHWSLSSGGLPANIIPGTEDRVVFDEFSFSENNYAVTINTDVNCYSLTWVNNMQSQLILNGFTIWVSGILDLSSSNLEIVGIGKISFSGDKSPNNFIEIQAATNSLKMEFNGDAKWRLLSDINLDSLILLKGEFDFSDQNIDVRNFLVSKTNDLKVDFSNSIITGIQYFEVDNTNLILIADNSDIRFDTSDISIPLQLISSGHKLNNLVLQKSQVEITGDNNIESITMDGILSLTGNNNIELLNIKPGSVFNLGGGSNQTIGGILQAIGALEDTIKFTSNGGSNANLISNNSERFCLDYLRINNVDVSGSTQFVAGKNSIIVSSTGWIENDCSELIFAQFDEIFTCTGGTAGFFDTSTGNPTSWNWSFGEPSSGEFNQSTFQNPTHVYSNDGTYTVTLEVSSNDGSDTFSKQITVSSLSGLTKPTIINIDNRLISSIEAKFYQWYRNGQAIPGANEKFIDIPNIEDIYMVEVWDDNCRFFSDPLIVNDLEIFIKATTSIFPNPITNRIELQMDNALYGKILINIYNSAGQIIWVFEDFKDHRQFTKLFDTQHFNIGLYFVIVSIQDFKLYYRIIKE